MSFPPITVAQVVQQDADGGGLTVVLKASGQAPTYSVRVLYYGAADALRIKQHALPSRGTWGLVAFPYGDSRNGVWLGSILPAGMDAITTTTAGSGTSAATDPFIDYEAHFSGFMKMLDGMGNYAAEWPDGSYVIGASGTSLPVPFRHTVGAQNSRDKVAFPIGQRNPNQPSAFNFLLHHKSGTSISIDPSGKVIVSGVSDVSISSATNVNITATGNITVNATGSTTISANGDVSISASGALIATGQPISLN